MARMEEMAYEGRIYSFWSSVETSTLHPPHYVFDLLMDGGKVYGLQEVPNPVLIAYTDFIRSQTE